MVDPKRLRAARRSVSAAFLVHAAVLGTWAPRIPAIKHRLHLDHGEIGLALTGMAVGFLAGTRLAGPVSRRIGTGPSTRCGALVVCAALIGPALAGGLAALTLGLVALGVAGGFLDVVMNAQAVLVERRYGRPIMSGFHALWSVGSMASAVAAGIVAAATVGVVLHFGVAALALAAAGLVALRGLLSPHEERAMRPGPVPTEPLRKRRFVAPVAVLLGIIGFCSLVAEGSALDWSAVFLRENLGAAPAIAAAAFAAFSLAMALVRFTVDRLSARFGPVAVVRAGGIVGAAGLLVAVGAWNPAAGVAGFALLGAGVAPVVPSTFSAAGNTALGPSTTALGGVVTASYLGSIVGPLVIGFTADLVGLRAALAIPALLAVVIAAAAGGLASPAASASPARAAG